MTRYQANYQYPIEYEIHSVDMSNRALEIVTRNLGDTLLDLIFDQKRSSPMVISQVTIKKSPEPEWVIGHELSVEVEYAREMPVILFGGYTYKTKEIRYPETLKFWERVKFIFTGEYPH